MKILEEDMNVHYEVLWNGEEYLCDDIDNLLEAFLAAKAFARKKSDEEKVGAVHLYAVNGLTTMCLAVYRTACI